jgi:hypothetical protein
MLMIIFNNHVWQHRLCLQSWKVRQTKPSAKVNLWVGNAQVNYYLRWIGGDVEKLVIEYSSYSHPLESAKWTEPPAQICIPYFMETISITQFLHVFSTLCICGLILLSILRGFHLGTSALKARSTPVIVQTVLKRKIFSRVLKYVNKPSACSSVWNKKQIFISKNCGHNITDTYSTDMKTCNDITRWNVSI